MKLSDVMSAMDLAVYAEVGLVIFFVAFAAIAIDVLRRGRSLESHAALPLESESAATPPSKESTT